MAGTKKYNRREESYNLKNEDNFLPILKDQGIPVSIDRRGYVHARGFIDTNDNLEFTLLGNTLVCKHPEGGQSAYTTYYNLTNVPSYSYTTIVYDKLYKSFQNYLFTNRTYSAKNSAKYKRLNKRTKNLIKSAVANVSAPKTFHYNYFKKGSHRYVEPEISGTWLGPYNYDTYLRAEGVIQNIEDLIVIKSGELKKLPDDLSMAFGIKEVLFTTGVSGHVYVETTSIPRHVYGYAGADNSIRSFKFKNTGNSNLSQASTPVPTQSGVAGVFTNGIFLHTVNNGKSYNDSGVWNENSFVSEADKLDACLGTIHNDNSIEDTAGYHYKSLSYCAHSIDTSSHSPIIGYAKDGYPIYGPVAYSTAGNSSSALKILQPSYRLKQSASRTDGPNFDSTYVSGYYVEDYEYVNALGDLDAHNGRTGVTPEYPNGTYAYFTTVNENHSPKYPYVIGPTYYGNIDSTQGLNGPVTEAPLTPRVKPLSPKSRVDAVYPNPAVNSWELYGDEFTKTDGLVNDPKIIFVSPHLTKEAEGVFLKTGELQSYKADGTAATYSGNKFVATGNGKFLIEESGYRFPSSDTAMIYGDTILSGGMYFTYVDLDGGGNLIPSFASKYTTGTAFYTHYSGHKKVSGKVHDVVWDGKIPAGTPFRVEHWSFNGHSIGFNGKMSVVPCEAHPLTSGNIINLATNVTGYGESKEEAYTSAMLQATENLKRQNNVLLVNSGVKNENARMRNWRKMKESQATNLQG
tara:strand:+ start:8572 stop:10797 length:2226 start_codon:yes stop_codon:yes gene_type:complete